MSLRAAPLPAASATPWPAAPVADGRRSRLAPLESPVVRRTVQLDLTGLGWLAKLGLSAGFAGFVALSAQLSIPLPWTPVPFSLQPLAVLVTGAVLGRNHGLLSIALYILAGALGLQVFADGSGGLSVLAGATAGYIFGFAVAAYFVGWYLERPRPLLGAGWSSAMVAGFAVAAAFALVSLVWLSSHGARFQDGYSATQDHLWLFLGLTGLGAVATVWILRSSRGVVQEKDHVFLVMLAGLAMIHVPGVVVLKAVSGWSWSQAIALGSTVFLPFDLIKAGLATAAAMLFLPSRNSGAHT